MNLLHILNSKWVQITLMTVWTVLTPIHGALGAALALTMIDMATGMYAAKKRGEVITQSRGWRRTIVKLAVYDIAIICGFLCENYMTGPIIPAMKLASTLIGTTELKSILENLDSISGSSFFTVVVNKLSGPLGDKLSKPSDPNPPKS